MTDETEKTVAQLEAEGRERIRRADAASIPESAKTQAHQPVVTALKKRGKKRLAVLALGVFATLCVVAGAGDHLITGWLKGHKPDDTPPASAPRVAVERTGMGMEVNALALSDEKTPDEAGGDIKAPASVPAAPVTFDKTAALSDSNRASSSPAATSAPDAAPPANYSPCPVALEKDATGRLICPTGAKAKEDEARDKLATVTTVSKITLNPDLYIPVDTYIPCALLNRFVSTVAGKITCVINEDIYSASRNTRLIPAGTKARGVYVTGTIKQGDARMLVAWTELRTPDGKIIPMVDAQVVGQLGENGIAGWVDNHQWERLYSTLLISMVPDIASAAADNAPGKDRNTDYTENTRSGVAEIAKSMMENSANIAPTIYKNQGETIGISTGADIDFSSVYRLTLH